MYYCQVFAKHSYSHTWKGEVFCSTMAGQETLKLLGCKNIYIEYFQRLFIKGKGKTNSKYKNATVLDNSCMTHNIFYLKTQNGYVPRSPNWSISYNFLYKKAPFFRPKGVPLRVIFSRMHFPCKMLGFGCRIGSYLVWIDTIHRII